MFTIRPRVVNPDSIFSDSTHDKLFIYKKRKFHPIKRIPFWRSLLYTFGFSPVVYTHVVDGDLVTINYKDVWLYTGNSFQLMPEDYKNAII